MFFDCLDCDTDHMTEEEAAAHEHTNQIESEEI